MATGYKRHKWSEDIKRDVKAACVRDNWHCFLQLAEDYFVFAIAVALPYLMRMVFDPYGWGSSAWIVTYVMISNPLIGLRMRALAELLHQSSHKTLAKN